VRSQLINWLEHQKLQVKEETWTAELVKEFEAIAHTNSVVEIMPIHTVILPACSLKYNPYHLSFQQLRSFFSTTGALFVIN
jgi:4-amino-4-deoxychorismate lyase